MALLTFALLLLAAESIAQTTPLPIVDVTVTSPAGTIIGRTARYSPLADEFLGIPFALPPTGPNRFRPPIRKPKSAYPILAQDFGYSCISQQTNINISLPGFPDPPEGEDCLNLNIWRRKGSASGPLKPVLVWIYGGGFIFGSANTPLYDGTTMAHRNDVIVVSINYRTNIFGFPNAKGLARENVGILDQRAGLEWVRDNIASFGGDPKQITLFGHSAGGASVDIHAYAWPKDPIVAAYISQSGVANLGPLIGGVNTYYSWGNVTRKVGCNPPNASPQSPSDRQVLACMKKIDYRKIADALGPDPAFPCGDGNPSFGPRVDNKVIFSREEYARRGKRGEFAKLPFLVGVTDAELNPKSGLPSNPNSTCPPIISLPFAADLPSANLTAEALSAIAAAFVFDCPARTAASYRAINDVPVWRYRYFGYNLNLTLPAKNLNLNLDGAHSAELPVLFSLVELLSLPGSLPPHELAFATYLQSAWTSFARSPATALSSDKFKWEKHTPGLLKRTVNRLAYEDEVEASKGLSLKYDLICEWIDDEISKWDAVAGKNKRGLRTVRREGIASVEEKKVRAVLEALGSDGIEKVKRWAAGQLRY